MTTVVQVMIMIMSCNDNADKEGVERRRHPFAPSGVALHRSIMEFRSAGGSARAPVAATGVCMCIYIYICIERERDR